MSGRDPRLDPRAGDVLRKGRRQRIVKRVGAKGVVYTHEQPPRLPLYAAPVGIYSSPKQWAQWAATAVVVRTAEEGEK